jgi:formate C-acetyltransferase
VDAMCRIHWSHDRYYYESVMMALVDSEPRRFMAFGVAGLSCLADSLSAIKHARAVTPVVDEATGLVARFETEGDWPAFGNDDPRVDDIAAEITRGFLRKLRERGRLYRDAEPTLSVLTITSNVMYGRATGATPDGRERGAPFAPGANPMHERDRNGALASLNSVARVPYDADGCLDGVSNTFSIGAGSLGKTRSDRTANLVALLDEYFATSTSTRVESTGDSQGGDKTATRSGQHLNVNVVDRATLTDAVSHPEKYPNLTVRISGYAVRFNALAPELQEEIIKRTFHERV